MHPSYWATTKLERDKKKCLGIIEAEKDQHTYINYMKSNVG